jgi:hypothetical protein
MSNDTSNKNPSKYQNGARSHPPHPAKGISFTYPVREQAEKQ